MQGTKAKNFTEFRPWHEGHKLVLTTYRFLRAFPDEGQFSLRDEMKKAVEFIFRKFQKYDKFHKQDIKLTLMRHTMCV